MVTGEVKGATGFVARVQYYAGLSSQHTRSSHWFIDTLACQFAGLDLADWWRPWRWFRAMGSAKPPEDMGPAGFRVDLVDDNRPARHYVAFLMIGYYLTYPLGWLVMYGWEILGWVRYGSFSRTDILLAKVGLQHGVMIRRDGPEILADLIVRDLLERNFDQVPNVS
ncbi:MAG: hypothetical protein EXR62_08925 [Chloroflexi bacterium]|nr:hypothetical protein [Chloroflexota bacterium]